jgi:hypothetical protein
MADKEIFALLLSPEARSALVAARAQHGISDSEIASSLVDWLSSLDDEEQCRVLDEAAALQSPIESPMIVPFDEM